MSAEQPFVKEDGVFGSTLWLGRKKAAVEMHVPRAAVARCAHPALDFRTIALLDEDGAACFQELPRPSRTPGSLTSTAVFIKARTTIKNSPKSSSPPPCTSTTTSRP